MGISRIKEKANGVRDGNPMLIDSRQISRIHQLRECECEWKKTLNPF